VGDGVKVNVGVGVARGCLGVGVGVGGTGVGMVTGVGVTTCTGVNTRAGVGEGAVKMTVRVLVICTKFHSIKSPIHTMIKIISITMRKTKA